MQFIFQMNYEYNFNNSKTGIQLSPMLILKKTDEHEKDGYGGELQVKFYVLNNIRDESMANSTVVSLYAGPYLQYVTLREVEKSNDQLTTGYPYYSSYLDTNTYISDISSFAFGGVFGLKLSIRNAFIIEPFVGLGIMYSDKTTTPEKDPNAIPRTSSPLPDFTVFRPGYTGIYFRIGFQMGVRF